MQIETVWGKNINKFDRLVSERIIELTEKLYVTPDGRQRKFIETLIKLNQRIKFELSLLQDNDDKLN